MPEANWLFADSRNSIFGNLSFGKKKAAAPAEASPAKEAPATTEAVAETAPVIPAVETTEPLTTEVAAAEAAPAETVEAAPAANGETKPEVKAEKRKSSLPFFGKKKETASSDEETEKPKSPSAFSKLRATIKVCDWTFRPDRQSMMSNNPTGQEDREDGEG